jgi:23S rRNA pseudouridine1911/1915/1917 synthase
MSSPSPPTSAEFVVDASYAGARLDWYLAQQLPDYSRVALRRAINAKQVLVDGQRVKAAHPLRQGQHVQIELPEAVRPGPQPEAIPLDILYEDDWLVAINKPPAMVVHPAKGHWSGTLTAALQHHFDTLSQVGGPARPGIVHRLDRDTSGVMVVARTDQAHLRLAEQFENRTVEKEYFALVVGRLDRDQDYVDAPIGIHPYQREKMAIREDHSTSRPARTYYQTLERFRGFAAARVLPRTGRTHQIRVHLAHIGCPVLCDRQYGGRDRLLLAELQVGIASDEVLLERQALHARRLSIAHPQTGAPLSFEAPLPPDLERTLAALRQYRPL